MTQQRFTVDPRCAIERYDLELDNGLSLFFDRSHYPFGLPTIGLSDLDGKTQSEKIACIDRNNVLQLYNVLYSNSSPPRAITLVDNGISLLDGLKNKPQSFVEHPHVARQFIDDLLKHEQTFRADFNNIPTDYVVNQIMPIYDMLKLTNMGIR